MIPLFLGLVLHTPAFGCVEAGVVVREDVPRASGLELTTVDSPPSSRNIVPVEVAIVLSPVDRYLDGLSGDKITMA